MTRQGQSIRASILKVSLGLLVFGNGCSAPARVQTLPIVNLAPGDAAKHSLAAEAPALLSAAIEQGTFTCVLPNDLSGARVFRVTFTPPTPFTTQGLIDPQGWMRTINSPEHVRLEKRVANVAMFLSFSGAGGIFNRAIGGFEGTC
jgi:hypothetical protein